MRKPPVERSAGSVGGKGRAVPSIRRNGPDSPVQPRPPSTPDGPTGVEAALRSRGAILAAVGFAAEEFLRATSWEERIDDALARLGEAAAVSRVYVFQNHSGGDGTLRFNQISEWAMPGIAQQANNPALQNVPWHDSGFGRWAETLGAGEAIHGHVRDFPASEINLLLSQDILSLAVVPIFVGQDWWGLLGFDECLARREWSKAEMSALKAAAGTLGAAIARQRAENALREAELKYQALVEQIPAIVYMAELGETGDWLYMSPQLQSILGYTPEEWLAHPAPFSTYLHPADKERVLMEEARSSTYDRPLSSEYRMVARDGHTVWIHDAAVVVRDDAGQPLFWQGVMHDITVQKRAEEQIAFLAYHDKLTDLPNRAMFQEMLDLALARAERHDLAVAVLSLDLDDFKLVNESLGHPAGDELLRLVADRLREASRETDLVARQGGDEFLLLLADLERTTWGTLAEQPKEPLVASSALLVAESVASRIHEALQTPFVLGDTEVYITASVGVSVFPLDAMEARSLLKNADVAMYRSKKAGPGGYVVFSKDSADPVVRLSLATRLRKAVEHKDWILHYQPIVDLADGRMQSVEALVRWENANGTLTPPSEFIPLAEEMGLIEAIGEWVLVELSRQFQEWRELGLDIPISFNLSPRQLWQPSLVENILGQLNSAGIAPRDIVIEVTESTSMTDPERTLRILRNLHDAGLKIALDDFGTGYSSLSRLKLLPVDILKIDQSFIRDIPGDRQACSMVKAIVELAHGLEMMPLAEGIETQAQREFLWEHGCARGQGYHFSRPVPGQEITARYSRPRRARA
jgi:diguanylate cyclase (GGDEF)-like protein/PAS domain S-box-containing protein